MHETSFIDVHQLAIFLIEYQVTPWNLIHFARQRQVLVPAFRLGSVEFIHVAAAGASAGINERVVVDVLIAELSEAVTTSFVLDDSAEIHRVAVVTLRTVGDGLSSVIHVTYSTIFTCVRHNDDQCLVEIPFVDCRSLAGIFEYLVVVALSVAASKGDTTFC